MNLIDAERRLQAAQRDGDLDALDALLHPQVVGAGPDANLFTKADDLDAYRSGSLRMIHLEEEAIELRDDGNTGMTHVVASVVAMQHGSRVVARLRYTRLWVREKDQWRVMAATFATIDEPAGSRADQ